MPRPGLEDVNCPQEASMERIAILVSIFTSVFAVFVACFLPLILSESKAAKEKARARRLAEARMNARLLRFNI